MNEKKATGKAVLLACLLAGSAMGMAADANISKEEIIARAWKALFGERRNADVRSIYVERDFPGSAVRSRTTVKRPNLFRNELPPGVLVFDGQRAAWAKRAPDKEGNPRGPELIEPAHWKHFEVDIALIFPAFFDYPAEFEGVERTENSDAYRIHVPLPLGGSVTYFIESRSFLVTKRLVGMEGGGSDPREEWIAGYADYDGMLFPLDYFVEGREGKEKRSYRNVRFNTNPGDELFAIPEELK